MGCALSRRPTPACRCWHETAADRLDAAAAAARVTSTSTSRSSAPATPASGPRTTSPRPTRRCGSRCSRPRSPASARPGATAAGARRSSRPRCATLAALPGSAATARSPSTPRCAPPSTRSARVAAAEGIDAHFAQGRHDRRSPARGAQLARARAEVADARAWGRGEDDLRLLDAARGRARCCAATDALGATYTPDCAADPPGPAGPRAGRGGRAPRRHASTSGPAATAIEPGAVRTAHGTVRAGRRGPRDRGLHAAACRACARAVVPGLLADRRDRAAARGDLGARSGWRGARRSPTTGT